MKCARAMLTHQYVLQKEDKRILNWITINMGKAQCRFLHVHMQICKYVHTHTYIHICILAYLNMYVHICPTPNVHMQICMYQYRLFMACSFACTLILEDTFCYTRYKFYKLTCASVDVCTYVHKYACRCIL